MGISSISRSVDDSLLSSPALQSPLATNSLLSSTIHSLLCHSRYLWPLPAAFSNLWLLYQCRRGKRFAAVEAAHKKYGKLFRIQPNHVSIADNEAHVTNPLRQLRSVHCDCYSARTQVSKPAATKLSRISGRPQMCWSFLQNAFSLPKSRLFISQSSCRRTPQSDNVKLCSTTCDRFEV